MKGKMSSSFVIQALALIAIVIVVHTFYASFIRPNANAIIADRAERLANDELFVPERSFYVTIRDYEQETCFILMFWALFIMGLKTTRVMSERKLLESEVIQIGEGISVLPEDASRYMRPIQSLPEKSQSSLLSRTVLAALQRFETSQAVQNASEAVRSTCEAEADRLDSELAMIRYIAWAIPSIGFIGTVRGIGEALGQAYLAVQGDIAGVTESLGVAFNSTFVALVISIVIMFFVYQLQRYQEDVVIAVEHWCDHNLLSHLQVR